MKIPEERKDICPVCLQPIEPEDDVIEEGERDVHASCHFGELISSAATILSKAKPIAASPKPAPKKRR